MEKNTRLKDPLSYCQTEKELQERRERMRDEHKGNAAKYQELEKNRQQALSDLWQKEAENIKLRHEFEQEYSTSSSVSPIIWFFFYSISFFEIFYKIFF